MAKPKQCAHCKKPATIHLTQIVGGEIRKVDLCESCQFKDSLAADFDLEPFAKLAEGVVEAHGASGESHVCPSCGCDDDHLRRTGRFGCPDCYRAFESVVPDLLGKIHPGLSHEGKVPLRGKARQAYGQKRAELRRELESAVREERFEDAAVYRDRIRKFETEEKDATDD